MHGRNKVKGRMENGIVVRKMEEGIKERKEGRRRKKRKN